MQLLGSPSVRPKINFLGGCLGGLIFCVWCLLGGNRGTPLPWPVFRDQYFSWVPTARSLRNKDLQVKSLLFFHLGTLRQRLELRDGYSCFLPTLDPHFVPIKKSSLTRPRPGEGASSCVRGLFGGYDGNGRYSTLLTGHVTFSRRWGWRSVMAFTVWV